MTSVGVGESIRIRTNPTDSANPSGSSRENSETALGHAVPSKANL